MTLTGIFKSILLVITSVLIWGTPVSPLQSLGYSTALAGLCSYSLGPDQVSSIIQTASSWSSDALGLSRQNTVIKGYTSPYSAWTQERRRAIAATTILCFISILVVAGIWHGPVALRRAQDVFPTLPVQQRLWKA